MSTDASGDSTPISSSPSTPRREVRRESIHTPPEKFSPYGIISGVIHDFSHLSDTKQLLSQSPSKIRQRKKKEYGPDSVPTIESPPPSEFDSWQYPGWGSVSYEDIDVSLAPKEPNRKILGLWPSTAIAGNDLLASVLYTIGVTTVHAGPLSPISLLLVVLFLWPYRWIYSEVGSALPLNGGSYNCLLNATSKSSATIAACLSLISYTATAVVSAASATEYLHGEVGGFDVFWPTLGILAFFAFLVFLGIKDSAIVATIIFTTHACVLTILIFASIVKIIRTQGDLFSLNYSNYNFNTPVKDVFFGFSVGLLGITGFETASNYIEEIKEGVFPRTMNLMWVLVAIYNPTIAFLSTGVVEVEEIQNSPANGLSVIANAAAGKWLRMLIAIDGAIVLCGGVLTGFIGVVGLIKRLAEDNCLPKLFLHKNRLTKTHDFIVLAFFILTASLYAIVDGNITSLSGVFAVSFLSVMCMFAIGNLILKFKRPALPRLTVAPWYWVLFGLSGMLAGLIGNLVDDPKILIYFAIYFSVTMAVIGLTLGRIMVTKLLLVIVQHVRFLKRFERPLLSILIKMRQTSVIFFTKTDKIHILNKAVLYAHQNEMCDHIKLIHIYNDETDIPSQLKENHYILDHMYPKIKIDLVLIQGVFNPETVRMISTRFKVPLPYMFIQCPSRDFPYGIGEFGGIRTIMSRQTSTVLQALSMTSVLRIFNKGRSDKIDYIDSILNDERPSNEEINKQFDVLMNELGVVGSKRDEMQQWPSYKKWDLINQSRLKQEFDKTKQAANKTKLKRSVVDTPEFYVTALKTKPEGATLKGLRVCVASNMVSWLQQYLQLGGLEVLLNLLNSLEVKQKKTTKDLYVIYECVQCIKAVMNNDSGMLHAVETPKTIFTVCLVLSLSQLDLFSGQSIDPQKKTNNDFERFFLVKTITAAMDILAAVALLAPEGHRFVLDALNHYSVTLREKRFLVIVRCLVNGMKNARSSSANEDFYQYLVSCMVLVNIIVNGPDELRIRNLLRNEFFQLGLEGMLKELSKLKSEELKAQIETFNGVMADDYAEMEERFLDMNAEVPMEMARKIIQNLYRTTGYKFFLSILHNLYIVAGKPDEQSIRCLRVFEDMTNRVMMKEFPGDLEMDKAYLQSIVGTEHKISRPGVSRSQSAATLKPESRLNRKLSVRDINESGGSSLSLSGGSQLNLSSSSFFSPRDSGKELPPAPSPPHSSPSTHSVRETLLISSRETLSHGRVSSPPSPHLPSPPTPPSPTSSSNSLDSISVTELNNGAGADLLGGALIAPVPPSPKGLPPPPPPGPGLKGVSRVANLPKKNVMKAGVRMKQFHWRKIPENKLADTFWLKIQDVQLGEELKTLEQSFCAKEDEIKKAMDDDSGTIKPNVIHLLDRKRSDNISIVLSHLKMSPTDIKYAVMDMDEERLDLLTLDQMLRFMPTKEEEELIKNCPYEDQPFLDKPEQYAMELFSIPSIALKLEAWVYKRNFQNSFADILPSIIAMQDAMNSLKGSTQFTKLMEVILTIGNFLNGVRGVVYGFKFDCLLRLRDTKTVDNKSTLLHFLADLLNSKYPEAFKFYSSISNIEAARKVNLQTLRADLSTLKKGFASVTNAVAEIQPGDKFYSEFTTFLAQSQAKLQKAESQLTDAEKNFSNILTYYGEDQVSSEDFFGILYRFHVALQAAFEENSRRKESEQKAALMAEKRRLAKMKAKESEGTIMETGLDDIVTALHKNNLLRIRRDNQRAGVPPPPELQAVLQLRKNLKRSSFYSKQGLGNGVSDSESPESAWGSDSPREQQTIEQTDFRSTSPPTTEEDHSSSPRFNRPSHPPKPLPFTPDQRAASPSPRRTIETVPVAPLDHELPHASSLPPHSSPRSSFSSSSSSPKRKHTVTSRVGSYIAPPLPPPVSASYDQPNLLDEDTEDVHIQENIFVQNNRKLHESRSRMVTYAGNISLNMDLVKMRGASLLSFEEGKPILLKIRAIMPYVEKAKSALTTPVQVDRSPLNRASDDKLAKVQSAIEVFTTEIQMIMNSLSENSEALSDADLDMLVEQLQKVDELSDVSQLD